MRSAMAQSAELVLCVFNSYKMARISIILEHNIK